MLSVCLSLVAKSSDINFGRPFAHNEDLQVSYRSLNVNRQDEIGGEGTSMGQKKMHSKLIVKHAGRKPLGRSMNYEDSIKTDPNKRGHW
jgi:hypothetical protein